MTSRYRDRSVTRILPSSKSCVMAGAWISTVKHPGDVLFYATLSILNAVVGSRYRIAIAATNVELVKGNVSSTDFDLTGLPVYENPMLVRVDIRKASTDPKYQPFTTYAYLRRNGSSAYISQQGAIV